MKGKVLAVLAVAGALTVSGTVLAEAKQPVSQSVEDKPRMQQVREFQEAKEKRDRQYQIKDGKLPANPPRISNDRRPPLPPKGSPDRRPPEFDGKKPPVSRDNRMPPPPEAHSRDKRPQMPRKSK